MDDMPCAPPRRTYNILCLGETGSGKTTTLAAIRSYIDLPAWKNAYCARGIEFPTKLTFNISRGRDVPVFAVNMGDDDNEDHSVSGQSYTQMPKTYRINYENTIYNFIDVPGSGDTRGVAKDDENSQRIIQAIQEYDNLHMILIFMKSTDRRLTIHITYCLNEALAKLHKENIDQIGFVVTHSRGTEYQAGDALEAIKAFLENLQHRRNIIIKANRSNVYPVEHEAFKTFVAIQQQPDLLKEINVEKLQESWQESRASIIKLLQDIPEKVPQEMIKTLSVNEARTTVLCLMEPLAATTNTIEANRRLLEENEDAVIEMMVNEGIQREYVPQEESTTPVTVCTSEGCQERVPISEGSDEYTIKYKECHKPCYQPGIPLSVKGDFDLRRCEIFETPMVDYYQGNDICSVCRCDHIHHQHMTANIRRAVRDRYIDRTDRPTAQRQIQVRLQDLIEEQERILTAVAHFGRFLKENAIISMNDAFEQVLETQIAKEEDARNDDQVRRLQDVLHNYQARYRMITTAESEGVNVKNTLRCEQIHEVVNELFDLPINGRRIQELYEAAVEAYERNNGE